MVGEGDEGAEAGLAADELAGAVDRVDDPDRCLPAQGVVHLRIGVHRLLADDHRAGQEAGEGRGEVFLGKAVGGGDEVVRTALLDDLVCGELPVARHDLGGGRCADRRLDLGQVPGKEVIDHDSS